MLSKILDLTAHQFETITGPMDQTLKIIQEKMNYCDLIPLNKKYGIQINAKSNEELAKALICLERILFFIDNDDDILDSDIFSKIFNVSKKKIRDYDTVVKTYERKSIKPKTEGQANYVLAIQHKLITIVQGDAGSGKTLLAIASACKTLKNHEIDRIILSRPVIEAGENLGFLPGDLQEKVDPYMRPLYDSLNYILSKPVVDNYIAKGIIEIAPLAYMRGRTLSDSFIILDEAQNATHEQLKMFLTRIGKNSKMVINMDPTQIDLLDKKKSCFADVSLFKNISDIGICKLTEKDISRHPVISKIVEAYKNQRPTASFSGGDF